MHVEQIPPTGSGLSADPQSPDPNVEKGHGGFVTPGPIRKTPHREASGVEKPGDLRLSGGMVLVGARVFEGARYNYYCL